MHLYASTKRAARSDTLLGMKRLRQACGPFFIGGGILHFVAPKTYEAIVPSYLPAKRALVYASGVAEAAGGVGLLIPATRRLAGWFLVLTLIAIFPANLEMALHPERYPQVPGGSAALKARLPFQAVFIAWVLAAARR
jgi:uncharacterized membrane protein